MSDLRIGVDGRPLVGNRTGIGVHTAEIASRLAKRASVVIASHAPIDDKARMDQCRFVVDASPFGVLWQQTSMSRVMRREQCDVVWGPHTTLPLTLDIPAVVSLHDLTSITMPHRHRLRTILSFNLFVRASLEKAVWIAADSRVTAEEVFRGFGIPRRKIEIVHNGVDAFFSPESVEREDFIFYAGTLEPRKGLPDLLAAWRSIGRSPRLILAGDPGWGRSPFLQGEREAMESGRLRVRGFVSREELRDLYRRCVLFVYPSHYEGFGLPPLEAMACGAPVLTTTGGAIPEVVGSAAEIVAPGEPDALARAIKRLLASSSRREELREAGLRRAATFSWDASAARIKELLVDAATGRA